LVLASTEPFMSLSSLANGMSNYSCWIGLKSCETPAPCSSTKVAVIQNINLIEYMGSTANVTFACKWYWR